MHITLIISSLHTGGAERVLSELANAWVSKGHEISLLTLSAPEQVYAYPLDSRIHVVQLNLLKGEGIPFPIRLMNIAQRILKIRKNLKLLKPDVIVSFVDVMNITTLLASRFLEVPVIVSERTHPAYYQLPGFYKTLRQMTYPWANKVISQTPSASGYFSTLPENKKGVIPNQVKKPKIQKSETEIIKPVRHIVSMGRLCPNKGFSTLITAFAEIASQNQDLILTIYGEGADRQNLTALIQQFNMTQRVLLPGTVQDIETALYQADLFVFPSHYEGFPNALAEAMAAGLPVIASNCSGNIEIVRDGVDGRLFGVGDVPQLTRLLKELMVDAPQRVVLSQGALGLPNRFSEASVLQMWDTVLDEVTRAGKS